MTELRIVATVTDAEGRTASASVTCDVLEPEAPEGSEEEAR